MTADEIMDWLEEEGVRQIYVGKRGEWQRIFQPGDNLREWLSENIEAIQRERGL